MDRSHRWLLGTVAAFVVGGLSAVPCTALSIDDFEQAAFSVEDGVTFGPTTLTQSGLSAPGSLGGSRTILVRNNTGIGAGIATLSLAPDSPDVVDDAVVLSVPTDVSAHVEITLLDVPASAAYNLRAAGDSVRVMIDQAPILGDVVLSFTDAQGRSRGLAINVSQPGPCHWRMPLDTNFDYDAITKLVLSLNVAGTSTPQDYRVSDVSVVPEPAALCLFPLTGLLLRRYRPTTARCGR